LTERVPDPSVNVDSGSSGLQYLTFRVGKDDYGVDILRVLEIRGFSCVRTVPRLPAYIRGVIDLRGELVPVVDLRIRFGADEAPCTVTTVMLIVAIRGDDEKNQPLGLVVDAVSDVLEVRREQAKAPPSFGIEVDTRYLESMITIDERVVLILSIDQLLSGEEVEYSDLLKG
jgi:purine-binding chemotaxis protein CheW